jgi:AcrR family transcriptional regulator
MIAPVAIALRGDIEEGVLDAAERLLGRYGYRKMTMDDIAREAGVGRRTLYLRFSGKEDIALKTIDRIAERVRRELLSIEASGLPPGEKLRQMLRARVLIRIDSVHDYYQSLDEVLSALRAEYMGRRRRYFDDEALILERVIRDGVSRRTFRTKDPMNAARALLTATNALLPHSLTVKELGRREAIDQRIIAIADLLILGLEAKGD